MKPPLQKIPSPILLLMGAALLFSGSASAADIFGYTEPYKIVKMSFPEPGVIAEMNVKEGDVVKEGQILARLDYKVLERELQIAREQLALRATRTALIEGLAKTNRVSKEELKKARADLSIDELKVQRSEAMIDSRTLKSPFNGLISEVKKEASESVSSSGTHVLTVVQLDKLTLNIYMPPTSALGYRAGTPTTVYFYDRKEDAPAKVDFVSPVTDAASSTIRVKFMIPNPRGNYPSGVRAGLKPADLAPTPKDQEDQ